MKDLTKKSLVWWAGMMTVVVFNGLLTLPPVICLLDGLIYGMLTGAAEIYPFPFMNK